MARNLCLFKKRHVHDFFYPSLGLNSNKINIIHSVNYIVIPILVNHKFHIKTTHNPGKCNAPTVLSLNYSLRNTQF